MVEAFKYSFAQRSKLGDPRFVPGMDKLVAELTSLDYANYIRSLISDTRTYNDYDHYDAEFSFSRNQGTAHISVTASNGDVVSATSTINLM